MNFKKHSDLEGKHAILSASKHYWVNYDEEKFDTFYRTFAAAQRGTELHDLACRLITLGIKLPRSHKTLNMYVNDGIGYKMSPEVVLFYSDNCFGTADTISFKGNQLRIHDLKTGVHKASMEQLDIYAALFCLEYGKDPEKLEIETRIYQNDDIVVRNPPPEDVILVMDKIISFDKRIDQLKLEE